MKMMQSTILSGCLVVAFAACGNSEQTPGAKTSTTSQPAAPPKPATPVVARPEVPARAGMQKVGDMLDAWTKLYKQNEKTINEYEGMPIMGLVTAGQSFIGTVQFDMLNPTNQDGRFEGKLALAGFQGIVERAGAKITFGYDDKLAKDGFGPTAKAGDHLVAVGSLALDKEYYVFEESTERAGKKISREHSEFKRLADGTMICLDLNGGGFDGRGQEEVSDSAIYLHNGPGRYDFVIGKAKTGPEFKTLSFADKGDLTKEQALALFKAAGYAIETSGGIQGGKLVVDK